MVRWHARSGPPAHQPHRPPSGALTVRARTHTCRMPTNALSVVFQSSQPLNTTSSPVARLPPEESPGSNCTDHRVRCHRGDQRERRSCCAPRTGPAVVARPASSVRCSMIREPSHPTPRHASRRRRRLRGHRRHRAQRAATAGRSDTRGHRPPRDAARASDVVRWGPIRCTNRARTLCDLGASIEPLMVERALDDAVRRGASVRAGSDRPPIACTGRGVPVPATSSLPSDGWSVAVGCGTRGSRSWWSCASTTR